jgi:hypothetical protein
MYRDADEVESFRAKALVPIGRLSSYASTPGHHHRPQIQDQRSHVSRAGGIQGHHRDLLWV